MEEYGTDRVKVFLAGDPLAGYFVAQKDLHAACLIRAARRRGIDDPRLDSVMDSEGEPWLRLELDDKVAYFKRGRLFVGPPGTALAQCRHINGKLVPVFNHKQVAKDLFTLLGFPVPEGRLCDAKDEEAAIDYCRGLGGPVCIKSKGQSQGANVFPNLTEESHWRRAFRRVAERRPVVLVERHWAGAAVRFHYIHPRVAGIRMDLPPNVDGDGVSTVAQLIEAKNVEKHLRTGHAPIAVDDDLRFHLERQGLDLGHVPAAGARLFLGLVSNGSKGGDGINCRNLLHPSYVREIERLCNAVAGLRVAAVDTKILDPAVPAALDNYVVLEANSSPGMVPFHFPWQGAPQDVAGALMDALLLPDWASPAPIVA